MLSTLLRQSLANCEDSNAGQRDWEEIKGKAGKVGQQKLINKPTAGGAEKWVTDTGCFQG